MKKLTFLRTDNWVTVDPCRSRVKRLLVPALTFTERLWKQGKEKAIARQMGKPLVQEEEVECFTKDHKGRISFPFGFVEPLIKMLGKSGYSVEVNNLTPPANPAIFDPRWDKVFDAGVELRHGQAEFLAKLVVHENGRFGYPTGWGKSFSFGLIGLMWPRARIAVVSKSLTVVRDRLYPDLVQTLGHVGLVCTGSKKRGRRVMCFTADSMRWLLKECEEYGNFDVVLFDECHLAGADNCAYMLGQIPGQPRMYGVSATQDMRADGKDYRVRGLFGPLRAQMEYEEARQHGMVVPMEVRVRKIVMDVNPCSGMVDEEKLRYGIWRNSFRNDCIVRDAVGHAAAGEQTMISCQVLEHVLNIKKRFDLLKDRGEVPDNVELVCLYRQHDSQYDWDTTHAEMRRKGVGDVFKDLPYMTNARRAKLTKAIERGKVLLFAGTTILNVGFDPKDMRVVSRADCTSSKIADTQVPGRNSRHGSRTGKQLKIKGIIRDYWDKFDTGLSQKFKSRERSYKKHGWKIKILAHRSSLQKKMRWE